MLEERNILLAVKPIYSERIFEGKKKVEFRRQIPKNSCKYVYVYETSPGSRRIVGQFTVKHIVSGNPSLIWDMFSKVAGMKEENYFRYCGNRDVIHAIVIADTIPYNPPIIPFYINPNFKPPQNYYYVSKEFELKINEIRSEVH